MYSSPGEPDFWWRGIPTRTWRSQRGQVETKILWRLWKRRCWRICRHTFYHNITPGVGTGGHGSWYGWGGRCVPGRITSWVQIIVSSGMWPSSTQGISHTTTWFWAASTAPPWGNTPSILGDAQVLLSNPRPPWQGIIEPLRPYKGRYQIRGREKHGRTPGYRRPRGG